MQFLSAARTEPLPEGACPTCFGEGTVMQILEGQGIVRGQCPTCLGDGKARAFPRPRDTVTIMYQGQTDAVVEGYPVSGMLVVPGEEGVCYVTRKMAMEFFGLSERAEDGVVEENRRLLLDRSRVGVRKYGVTLERSGLSRRALLQHALEEVLDLGNYLQAEFRRGADETALTDQQIRAGLNAANAVGSTFDYGDGLTEAERDTRRLAAFRVAARSTSGVTVVNPTDPGHDVEVLREQVRHLERRIRELHAERNAGVNAAPAPASPTDDELRALARRMQVKPWGIGSRIEDVTTYARAVLRAYGVGAPPAGYALVPLEPTQAMLTAGCDKAYGWPTYADVRRQWGAMLAAAPEYEPDTDGVAPSPAPADWPSISADEETVRAAIQTAQLMPNKDMDAYEALARLVTRATAGVNASLPPLTDEECDKAAAQAMDRVAAAKGMHALDLNPDVTAHHTLRRELIRAGYALATAGVKVRTIYDQRTAVGDACRDAAPQLYRALRNLLDAVRERRDDCGIESAVIADATAALLASGVTAAPTWCPIHEHYKWCEHNGGVMGPNGWQAPTAGVTPCEGGAP